MSALRTSDAEADAEDATGAAAQGGTGQRIVAKLGMITSLARYPCHIIALAEYRARLECATLLRIAASAAAASVAATRSLWLLCTRSACGVAKDNALARHLVTVLPPPPPCTCACHTCLCVRVCVLASVCAQVAKGLRRLWLLATSCGICFSFFSFPPPPLSFSPAVVALLQVASLAQRQPVAGSQTARQTATQPMLHSF